MRTQTNHTDQGQNNVPNTNDTISRKRRGSAIPTFTWTPKRVEKTCFRFQDPVQPDHSNLRKPIEFFELFFSEELVTIIVEETNKHARALLEKLLLLIHCHIVDYEHGWTPLLKRFVSFLVF